MSLASQAWHRVFASHICLEGRLMPPTRSLQAGFLPDPHHGGALMRSDVPLALGSGQVHVLVSLFGCPAISRLLSVT